MKFHENPSSASRFVACGQRGRQAGRQTDGQREMTKLIVAFRNFANAPKILYSAYKVNSCVLYGSQNTKQLFRYTTLT
jgi:hypothetical protein